MITVWIVISRCFLSLFRYVAIATRLKLTIEVRHIVNPYRVIILSKKLVVWRLYKGLILVCLVMQSTFPGANVVWINLHRFFLILASRWHKKRYERRRIDNIVYACRCVRRQRSLIEFIVLTERNRGGDFRLSRRRKFEGLESYEKKPTLDTSYKHDKHRRWKL